MKKKIKYNTKEYNALMVFGKETELEHDKKDIKKLAKLIKENKLQEAYKFFKSIDTFIREKIPMEVQSLITVNRCGEIKTYKVKVKVKNIPDWKVKTLEIKMPSNASDIELGRTFSELVDEIKNRLIEKYFEIELP